MSYKITLVTHLIEDTIENAQAHFDRMATPSMKEESKGIVERKRNQGVFVFFDSERCTTTAEVVEIKDDDQSTSEKDL